MRNPESLRGALAAWDFEHSRKRPKVFRANRWQVECRCGHVMLTMSEFYAHRIDADVEAIAICLEGTVREEA